MNELVAGLRALLFFTLLTGAAYPALMTALSQGVFPDQAGGSLLTLDGRVVGSRWLSQRTEDPSRFWPRPSAIDYNPWPSGGSNAGPLHAAWRKTVSERYAAGAREEMLHASGSGLDPHIRPASARAQIPRIAAATGVSVARLESLVEEQTEGRQLGLLGEPRVNVLALNLALEEMEKRPETGP